MIINPLLVMAVLAGFYMAVNIGANDVANSMGTSVGSGALTIRKAVIVAGVCTFVGAVLLGVYVTDTIRKGIIDPAAFAPNPNLLIYGMIAVLLGAGAWVSIATYLKLPVSTTHSIVGALIGFGLLGAGIQGIQWKIVGAIMLSWFISPIGGAGISYLLFTIIKRKILDTPSPLAAAKRVGPFFVSLVLFVIGLAVVFGVSKRLLWSLHFSYVLGIAAAIAIVGGLASYIFLARYALGENDEYEEMEELAKPLEILSASYVGLAQGANDVANSIGPIAAILAVMETQKVTMQVPVPLWVLVLGGIGLVIGISTWGYRVMETIGKKITEVTPTRGFAAEFGAATVVIICSRLGMPISTTHATVGSVVGVGMARGIGAINLGVIRRIGISWLVTLPVSAGFTMVIYKVLIFLLPQL
jgi:PiT family inorganic phosphate transporter